MTTKTKDIRIIGQGRYGCVYKPEIECADSKKSTSNGIEYISKVQNNNYLSKKEIEFGESIQKIANYNKRFAPIESSCPINYENDENALNKLIESCKSMARINNVEGFISCKIRYVGRYNLGEMMDNIVKNKRKNQQNMDKYFRTLAETHVYLLDSIQILNKNGILHMDFKVNNVMFDTKNYVPIIIDFGLSYKTESLKIENYINRTQKMFGVENCEWYNPWCIEVVLLSKVSHMIRQLSNTTELVVEQIIEDRNIQLLKESCGKYIDKRAIFEYEFGLFDKAEISEHRRSLNNFIEGLKNKKWIDIWEILTITAESWDNYGLSVLFINELNVLGLLDNKQNLFIKSYITELKKILLSDIQKRPKAEETKIKIHHIFQTVNQSLYNKSISELKPDNKRLNEKRTTLSYNSLLFENRILNQFESDNKNIIHK